METDEQEMLSQPAVFWAVAAALLAVYCRYQNVTINKTPQQVEAELLSYAPGARDAFVVFTGTNPVGAWLFSDHWAVLLKVLQCGRLYTCVTP